MTVRPGRIHYVLRMLGSSAFKRFLGHFLKKNIPHFEILRRSYDSGSNISLVNDNDNDKGTFIAPYLFRAHRRIAYFTTKREI